VSELQLAALKQALIAAANVPGIVEALLPLAVAAPLVDLKTVVEALQKLIAAKQEHHL